MKALLRLSPEITTKAAKTRARFTRRTAENLRLALGASGLAGRVRAEHARIYLEYDDPKALEVARRVFGVLSVSPAHEETWVDLPTLLRTAERLMADRVKGKTFAVRARVADTGLGLSGQRINEELGTILCAYGRVNLDAPDVTVRIEVRNGRIHYYSARLPAEGGMPVGVGGRAIVMLSAGYDSAVAAWLMMRRGIQVEFVSCRLGGEAHERAVVAVANRLSRVWAPGIRSRLVIVPFEETVERIRRDVAGKYAQLVLKRLMYRTAERFARTLHADAIVTGESVGQVSSQTLPNLRALTLEAREPFFRPLLGHSKAEIMDLAKRVGTHHLSSGVPEYCALGARPATSATAREVADQEARVGFDDEAVAAGATWRELPAEDDQPGTELTVPELPDGAVVLDIRTPPERRGREIPGAREVDPLSVIRQPHVLDADARYVVVCDQGQRSLWFARRLRDLGFQARSLAR